MGAIPTRGSALLVHSGKYESFNLAQLSSSALSKSCSQDCRGSCPKRWPAPEYDHLGLSGLLRVQEEFHFPAVPCVHFQNSISHPTLLNPAVDQGKSKNQSPKMIWIPKMKTYMECYVNKHNIYRYIYIYVYNEYICNDTHTYICAHIVYIVHMYVASLVCINIYLYIYI